MTASDFSAANSPPRRFLWTCQRREFFLCLELGQHIQCAVVPYDGLIVAIGMNQHNIDHFRAQAFQAAFDAEAGMLGVKS